MAEENITIDAETQTEGASTQEKQVTVAEMQRRIAKVEKQYQKELESVNSETDKRIAEALEKYKAEAELSGKELEEYRKKEAEREKQELLAKIESLEKDKTHKELTDEAIKTLGTRSLPVNEKILGFVVKETADETLQAIDDLEAIISDVKSQFAQTEPPKTSNSASAPTENRGDIFRKANIRNKH
ncbi:DUF4355 domain-containing protein [Streptococcus sp. H31]|uniref:capsid assembly scaffolding protein Gp46 family protein n=1 Tax=Streptococcus huangxiaojuni TaxID=3237239 RepID=UPI0034A3F2E9